MIKSLGTDEYHNFVFNVDLVLGNSSSGIIEVPILKTPTLNIGKRQKGRVFSKSIFQTQLNKKMITKKINYILSKKKRITYEKNFYKKNTAYNILKEVKKFVSKKKINSKIFYDIKK